MHEGGEIKAEYVAAIAQGRPYQLGAQFLLHVLMQQYNPTFVRQVTLHKTSSGEFADFPGSMDLASFDRSDRKFAALSRKTGVPVTNAVDSDWANSLAALNAAGVTVTFLCGSDKTKWFA